jgi:hypothetical protein
MRTSDIAKLAASVAAGYITEEAAFALVSEDSDVLLLGRLIEGDPSSWKNVNAEHTSEFIDDPAGDILDLF